MTSSFTRIVGAVALLLLAGYAFIALQGQQGIPGLMDKRRQISEYEKKNADLARKIEEQRERIDRFSDTPSKAELEIRQRLKLVKPGEKVFILQDQAARPAPAAPRQ